MRSKCPFNHCILCSEVNMKFNRREIRNFFFKYKTLASERSPWQQHSVNSSVRLPNHYTRAKLEKVLAITFKDIHYFIYIIYYS